MHEAVRPSLAAALSICVAVEIFPNTFCHALSASLPTQPTGATGVSFLFISVLKKPLLSLQLEVIVIYNWEWFKVYAKST